MTTRCGGRDLRPGLQIRSSTLNVSGVVDFAAGKISLGDLYSNFLKKEASNSSINWLNECTSAIKTIQFKIVV